MRRFAVVMVLGVVLLVDAPALAQSACDTCPLITCGETKHIQSDGGHTLTVLYKYAVVAGTVVSLQTQDLVNDGSLEYQIANLDEVVEAQPNGEAWICGWEAPESGEYLVFLYGAAAWGWNLSLTMHCGLLPEACAVSVVPETWSRVKALYQ